MDDVQSRLRILVVTGRGSKQKIYSEIYHTYARRVRGFIELRLTQSPADCDDLTQIVLMKVYANLFRYNPAYALSTWIFTIAHRTVIDHVRKGATGRIPETGDTGAIEYLPSGIGEPSEILIRKEKIRKVRECVARLRWEDRQIAYLRFYEDQKVRQIGRIMKMPSGTVKYRLYRIRETVKRMMEDEVEENKTRQAR